MLDKRDNFDKILKNSYDDFHAEVPAWDKLFNEAELNKIQPNRNFLRSKTLIISTAVAILAIGLFLGIIFTGDNAPVVVQIGAIESGKIDEIITIENKNRIDNMEPIAEKTDPDVKKQNKVSSNHIIDHTSITPTKNNIDTTQSNSTTQAKESENRPKIKGENATERVQSWSDREVRYKKRRKISLLATTSFMPSSGGKQAGGRMAMYDAAPITVDVSNYRNSVNFDKDQYKHKFPVNIAMIVGYEIVNRLSISTGFNYSYLESSAESKEKITYSLTQKVNYIGIPIALNYEFLRLNRFSMYALFGGMAEFNVGSSNEIKCYSNGKHIDTQKDKITIGGALFSLQGGVGAKYDIINKFGIFIEPGVNYMFDNISQPITYKTKTPLQFNLRVGFSVNL